MLQISLVVLTLLISLVALMWLVIPLSSVP